MALKNTLATWSLLLCAPILGCLDSAIAQDASVIRLSEPVEVTDQYETFGEPLVKADSAQPLREIMQTPDDYVDASVQVTAKVEKVCQKKGCFFVAQDGAHLVRVRFKDYGFFVPTDISGRTVTLRGVLKRHELSAEQAAHFNQDAASPNAFRAGAQYEIVATAVRVPLEG
ncbi:MAG: DUF4920 domain-containing protein [Pseudomonadota bacterium]